MDRLRYDVRTVGGDHFLRLWAHDADGYWYICRVSPLASKEVFSGALDGAELELQARYYPGMKEGCIYALPWMRGEIKNAKGSGSYIVYDDELTEVG